MLPIHTQNVDETSHETSYRKLEENDGCVRSGGSCLIPSVESVESVSRSADEWESLSIRVVHVECSTRQKAIRIKKNKLTTSFLLLLVRHLLLVARHLLLVASCYSVENLRPTSSLCTFHFLYPLPSLVISSLAVSSKAWWLMAKRNEPI